GGAQLVDQSGILDGDNRLGREIRHQLDLLVGERAHLGAVDPNGTDGFIILQHRYSQKASNPSLVYPSHNPRVAVEVALFFSHIGDVNRSPSASESAAYQRNI